MDNDARANEDVRKLGELIDGIEVAMLTTRDADGRLFSRPLQTRRVEFDGDLIFFTTANSPKIEQVERDPRVNLTYANPDSQTYVSITGTAFVVRDRAEIESLWSAADRAFFEGKDDPNLVLLKVRVEAAEYWDSPGNPIGRAFSFAAAVVTGSPQSMGENRKMDLRH